MVKGEKMKKTAEEMIIDNGYEGVVIFSDYSYDDALIGVTTDNRAVYDYDKMIEWLMNTENWSYEEASDWISYNTIRALTYAGENAPIVFYPLI